MPLHIPLVAGEATDLYKMVGTSDTYIFPDGDSDIAEMERTIVCEDGDMLIISFDGTGQAMLPANFLVNVEVNGVELGKRIQYDPGYMYTSRGPIALTRAYEIPSDGGYTVKVRGYDAVADPGMYRNYRTMTIQHIHS